MSCLGNKNEAAVNLGLVVIDPSGHIGGIMESLAIQKIRSHQRDKGQTLEQLAASWGLTHSMVVGWVSRGKFPKPEHVLRLAKLGVVDPADWYAEIPIPSKPMLRRSA